MYQWDEQKRQENIAKHGVDFAIAEDFEWETALIQEDATPGYGERRDRAIGYIGERVYVMIYTDREDETRIISLRPATSQERRLYEA